MQIDINHPDPSFNSYRAGLVKSLFNAHEGGFNHIAELPLEQCADWQIGLVVGSSGSGKTSIGKKIFDDKTFFKAHSWDKKKPIIDQISARGSFDDACASLSQVGLGSCPAWLRPYHLLSNGEQFRADLARIIAEPPDEIVIDEFTSVVDRQVARIGAFAFAKGWRKHKSKQVVLLSCHHDIVDWLSPDWIYNTDTRQFTLPRGSLQRPKITLEIRQGNWGLWPLFESHHYLKLPFMVAAKNYVGFVDGAPVAHIAVGTRPGLVEARACRLVVMPEWQGCGVGLSFLNAVCDLWRRGDNYINKPVPVLFHTSHPALASILRKHPLWEQSSCHLIGGKASKKNSLVRGKMGGHFRAIQGFRYYGEVRQDA
ncbi:MAG: ABC transporter ATP-binding protein [Alphaproteobacteria bacterium]|nr:ABC transporter ATP-binding protein [Alphaproteobacteria bacterium]